MPTVNELSEGEPLPSYAWPGGYPIIYEDRDNNTLCPACANKLRHDEFDGEPVWYDVYWEGPVLYCEECNAEIKSAYGDPEGEENERDSTESGPARDA